MEEKNFQEMLKNFGENYKKNWVWVNIGGIIMNTFFLWCCLLENDTLYSCLVSSCWEQWQQSLHKTKKGAWKAGNKWLQSEHQRAFDSRNYIGKCSDDFRTEYQSFRVVPVKVED